MRASEDCEGFKYYTVNKSDFSINKLPNDIVSREEVIELMDTFLLKMLIGISLNEADSKNFNEKVGKTPAKMLS